KDNRYRQDNQADRDAGDREAIRFKRRPKQIDDHRQERRRQENLDNGLVELFEELLPERLAPQRREMIAAIALAALSDLIGAKAGFGETRFKGDGESAGDLLN